MLSDTTVSAEKFARATPSREIPFRDPQGCVRGWLAVANTPGEPLLPHQGRASRPQIAAIIAGLLLTTETAIVEIKDKKKATAPTGGGA